MVRTAFQLAFLLLLLTIVALSVVPPGSRPVTAAPHGLEHLAAFGLVGATLGLGFPGRWMPRAALLVLFAVGIEFIQIWIPGRHARVSDLLVDAGGALLGFGLCVLARRLVRAPNPVSR